MYFDGGRTASLFCNLIYSWNNLRTVLVSPNTLKNDRPARQYKQSASIKSENLCWLVGVALGPLWRRARLEQIGLKPVLSEIKTYCRCFGINTVLRSHLASTLARSVFSNPSPRTRLSPLDESASTKGKQVCLKEKDHQVMLIRKSAYCPSTQGVKAYSNSKAVCASFPLRGKMQERKRSTDRERAWLNQQP